MRDIINLLYLLNESTGLAGRKPGDPFKNPTGEIITFNDIKFFPEEGGKYEPEQIDQVLDQISKQLPNINWQNAKNARTGGFGIASFTGKKGPIVIGRYLNDVKKDFTLNSIPNKFIANGVTYEYASKAAKKEQSGLSPLDLLTNRDLLTVPDVMNQLAQKLGTNNPLYAVAHKIAVGAPLPIEFDKPEGVEFTAFRDYFCEILQPIALQKGQFKGNAMEAANRFLDGTFEKTLITFGSTKTGGLTDSVLTNESGKTLLISSKGGKGAEASAKNLYDEVEKLKTNSSGQKFLKKYAKEVKLLDDIVNAGMHNSPLKLAVDEGLLDDKEAEQVRALRNLPKIDMANVGGLNLSAKLKSLAKSRDTDNPESVNIYYHLIASIAHKVAEHINKTTNFPKAAADILNNGALIQVYTKARESKDKWILDEFETVYPSTAIKGVFLSAGKNYFSTNIKGNFTFMIDKGKGVKDTNVGNQSKSTTDIQPDTEQDFAQAAAQIAGEISRTKKNKSDVGRERRKR